MRDRLFNNKNIVMCFGFNCVFVHTPHSFIVRPLALRRVYLTVTFVSVSESALATERSRVSTRIEVGFAGDWTDWSGAVAAAETESCRQLVADTFSHCRKRKTELLTNVRLARGGRRPGLGIHQIHGLACGAIYTSVKLAQCWRQISV